MDIPLKPNKEIAKIILKEALPQLMHYIMTGEINLELERPSKFFLENVTTDDLIDVKATHMNKLKIARREIQNAEANIQKLKGDRADAQARMDASEEEYEELKNKYEATIEDHQKAADELNGQHDKREAELMQKKEELEREIEKMRRKFNNEWTDFEAERDDAITKLSKQHKYEHLYHQNKLLAKQIEYNNHEHSRRNIDDKMGRLNISRERSTQKCEELALDGQALAIFGAGPLDSEDSHFILKHEPKEWISEWMLNDASKKKIALMTAKQVDLLLLVLKNTKFHENYSFGSCTSDQEVVMRKKNELLSERKIRALKVCTQGGNIKSNSQEVLDEFQEFMDEVELKKKRTSLFENPAKYYIPRTPAKLPSLKKKRDIRSISSSATPMKKRRSDTRTSIETPIRNHVGTPMRNVPLSLKKAPSPSPSISRLFLNQCSMEGEEVPFSDLSFHE